MKKKKIIICVAIALAVFCLSFASAMIILMLNQDGVQTDTFNDSPVGQNISRALNNCSEPQDYYALAQKLVDDNEIYYANEVIKYGYRQTNDKSLDIAVVTGKPTLETAIIEHDMGSISESVQYFLGRETVVGRPCYSGISLYYNPFIYTFDNTTHRIRTIEVSSLFSYDKLDEDLLNIALASEYMPGIFPAISSGTSLFYAELPYKEDNNGVFSSDFAYQINYDEDGTINQMLCGDRKITVSKTTTGYGITISADPYANPYANSSSKRSRNTQEKKFTVDMQGNNILKFTIGQEDRIKCSEIFNYADDGSYYLTFSRNGEEYKLTYNKENLIEKAVDINSTRTYEYTYNRNHLLSGFSDTKDNEYSEKAISYNDGLYIANFMDRVFFSYDNEGRIVSMTLDDSTRNMDTTIAYSQNGKISELRGELSNLYYLGGDSCFLTYNDNGTLSGYGAEEGETSVNIIRNDDGIAKGISFSDKASDSKEPSDSQKSSDSQESSDSNSKIKIYR